MNTELTKKLLDSFYLAEKALNMLPPLPDGITAQYIHILDAITHQETTRKAVRVSDVADYLHVSIPGVTRSLKAMGKAGLVKKIPDPKDGRAVLLTLTPYGREIHRVYVTQYHEKLAGILSTIPDEDALTAIRTITAASGRMREFPITLDSERSK